MRQRTLRGMALAAVLLCGAGPALAQTVRVSVKHILDAGGNRSSGFYTSDSAVVTAISQANTVLANNGFLWSLELTEIVDVAGASQYFDLMDGAQLHDMMEPDAIADPATYKWRFDAINVYIVNDILSGAGGICSFPMSHEIIAINNTGGILGNGIGWLHEIGHYLSLTHTFEECGCSPSCMLPCTGAGASHTGSCGDILTCNDTCPDTTNVMSYNSISVGSAVLSACQKENMEFELFDPQGVRSPVLSCESTVAFAPGDELGILLHFVCDGGTASLAAGTYPESVLTITNHVSLVPSGGVVLIQ